jgi:uncharacterized protein YukE
MSQPMQVDTSALREAATTFGKGADALRDHAIPAIGRAALPPFALPALDMGYGSNYEQAYSGVDLAAHLTANVMGTIGLALTRVANHYQGQDDKNAQMFHGQPIPPPAVPSPATMQAHGDGWDVARAVTITVAESHAVPAMLAVALAGLGVSSARAGGAAIVFPFGIFCLANLRDPLPHLGAADGWNEVEGVFADVAADMQKMVHLVTATANWQGDGANAFNSYVTNILAPMVGSAKGLAADMKVSSYEAAAALASALVLFIVATYTAITTCLAADADPEPLSATAIILATLGMWTSFIIEIVIEMVTTFVLLGIGAATIASAYKELHSWLKDQNDKLDGRSASLSPTDTTTIQDWNGWKK